MLKTIQIVALLQGFFLLFIVFKHKKYYKKPNFWLLFGCVVSVMLYTLGDDNYNLFVENANWYFFHDTLIITFFFLFIRYYKSGNTVFNPKDYIYFIPYVINVLLITGKEWGILEINAFTLLLKILVEISLIGYLCHTVYHIIKTKKENQLLYFAIPLTAIFIIDEVSVLFTKSFESPFFLDSYGVLLVAIFLFYYVLYKLIMVPKEVISGLHTDKYKTSSLKQKDVLLYKNELKYLMTEEKLFKNKKLTVDNVAKRLNIPRQHLSEILNVHMNIGFQDLLNHYRVEDFVSCLQNKTYQNYTLLAIAKEVGFNSKSSFNTTFKKIKGMTPSEFKKQLT